MARYIECGAGVDDCFRPGVSAAFGLTFPQWEMHSAWQAWLPGFKWLISGSFLLGLVEVFLVTGFTVWLFALVYNALGKTRRSTGRSML